MVEKYSRRFLLTCRVHRPVGTKGSLDFFFRRNFIPPWAAEWLWSWLRRCLKRDHVKRLPQTPSCSGELPAKNHSRPLWQSRWLVLEDGETLNNDEIHFLLRNPVTDRQDLWLSSVCTCTSFSLKPVEVVILEDGEGSTGLEKYMRLCVFPFFS